MIENPRANSSASLKGESHRVLFALVAVISKVRLLFAFCFLLFAFCFLLLLCLFSLPCAPHTHTQAASMDSRKRKKVDAAASSPSPVSRKRRKAEEQDEDEAAADDSNNEEEDEKIELFDADDEEKGLVVWQVCLFVVVLLRFSFFLSRVRLFVRCLLLRSLPLPSIVWSR